MTDKAKVSIEPDFKKTTSGEKTEADSQSAKPKKKVVKKIIRRVVKKDPNQSPVDDKVKRAVKRAATTVDKRDHDIRSDYLDKDVPLEKANLRLYMISIGLMVIFILITVGLLYAKSKIETNELDEALVQATPIVEEEVVMEVEEVQEPDEVEISVLDPEDITLEILNGSGIAGLASDTQEEFENLGYVVELVGNADDTETSQLFISSDYSEEELENLLDDVERRLGITSIEGSLNDLDTVARIILGAE